MERNDQLNLQTAAHIRLLQSPTSVEKFNSLCNRHEKQPFLETAYQCIDTDKFFILCQY
jgi:hypothetical protein